jgi:hypothetical protein
MADLTLSQIRSLKTTMEQAIRRAAEDAVMSFQRETGLAVADVEVFLHPLREGANIVRAVSTSVDPQL